MTGKVIIVVTSHDQLGKTKKQTGWYLPEVAHPYRVFTDAGLEVTFVSPKGGKAPMDEGSYELFKNDEICKHFLDNDEKKLEETVQAKDVNASEFKAVVYAGGHGPMYDLPECTPIAELAKKVYEQGGVLGAVCHGTVGLIPVKDAEGGHLIKGVTLTSFTDAEEAAVGLTEAMPFPLETKLKKLGANFVGVENFKENVQVSGRIITGQNPTSSTKMAQSVLTAIQAIQKKI